MQRRVRPIAFPGKDGGQEKILETQWPKQL
jgi:hypothetical protein